MAASEGDEGKQGVQRPTRAGADQRRTDRLAEALRANLMKRKAQARARRQSPDRDGRSGGVDETA